MNLLSGLVLVYGTNFYKKSSFDASEISESSGDNISDDELNLEEDNSFAKTNAILDDSTFRLIIGIVGFMVGVLKLCSPIQNDVKVIGDLLPVVAGIVSSGILLIEYFNMKSTLGVSLPSFIETAVSEGRKYIGIFCILIAVVHFICPRVLFL